MCFEGKGMMLHSMSEMLKGCTPEMMKEMMPQCLEMVIEYIPEEERKDFVLRMMEILLDKGLKGMSEEEKKAYVVVLFEEVKA